MKRNKNVKLKKTNMFPYNPNRMLSDNAKMYVRQYQIANSNSCGDDVVATTGNIYNGLVDSGDSMSPTTLCQLGEATATQLKELSIREKELGNAASQVSSYMSMLNKENNTLDKKWRAPLNKMKKM